MRDNRVASLKGNQVEVQPANGGPTEMKHIKHVKYILPANRYIKQLPGLCNLVFSHLQDLKYLERQAFNRFSCLHQVLKKIFP